MSRLAILGAVALSLGVHGVLLSLGRGPQEEPVQIAAYEGMGIASLGDSFEDMVTGSPVEIPLEPPLELLEETLDPLPEEPLEVLETLESLAVIAQVAQSDVVVLDVIPTLDPARETPLEDMPMLEPIDVAEVTAPLENVVRPPRRPEMPRERPRAEPRQQGGAETRTRGQETGQAAVAANASEGRAERAQAAEAGNAAVSNYPGDVMRKLSRTRRPNVNGRGTAVIAFRVSGSGAVSAVSVARSSGNERIDRAGVELVQRAGPFAPPPAGAQTSFSYEFSTR